MAHNTRIIPDPGWYIGLQWTTADIDALDASLVAAVNGDGGGQWNPAANLKIYGAGIRLFATSHTFTGSGSIVQTLIANDALLVHGDSDYCLLGSGHAGTTVTTTSPSALGVFPAGWQPVGAIAGTLASSVAGSTARIPLRVHNGSQFETAVFPLLLSGTPPGPPTQMPRFGVFAADMYGNVYPLSAATPYQAYPAGGTWADLQSFTFTCDAYVDNPYVLIDTTQFSYFAEIIDASGAVPAGVVAYGDVLSTFINIADIRPR
jgi:hypothetical protein